MIMPSHSILAYAADAYLPTLGLWLLYELISTANQRAQFIPITVILLSVFGMMFIDNTWGIWPTLKLDYSTHTALAAGLCYLIGRQVGLTKGGILVSSFIGYCGLMHYLNYHSWADMLATSFYMGCVIALLRNVPRQ